MFHTKYDSMKTAAEKVEVDVITWVCFSQSPSQQQKMFLPQNGDFSNNLFDDLEFLRDGFILVLTFKSLCVTTPFKSDVAVYDPIF